MLGKKQERFRKFSFQWVVDGTDPRTVQNASRKRKAHFFSFGSLLARAYICLEEKHLVHHAKVQRKRIAKARMRLLNHAYEHPRYRSYATSRAGHRSCRSCVGRP